MQTLLKYFHVNLKILSEYFHTFPFLDGFWQNLSGLILNDSKLRREYFGRFSEKLQQHCADCQSELLWSSSVVLSLICHWSLCFCSWSSFSGELDGLASKSYLCVKAHEAEIKHHFCYFEVLLNSNIWSFQFNEL